MPDSIRVEFADAELFISTKGIKIPEQNRVVERELMRQLPRYAEQLQIQINESSEGSKRAMMVILIFNIIFEAGLSTLFTTINALQIIIVLPMLKASMPANAGIVFRRLAEIAAFDYLEIGEHVDELLELQPTDPVNHQMETLGFETR